MNPKFPLHTCITDVTFSKMQYTISWWANSLIYLFFWANVWFMSSQLHEFYPQRSVCFVESLAKSLWTNILFQWPLPYVNHLWLVISLFLKFCIFFKYCKYVIVPGVSYGTWYSVTLFANRLGYAVSFRLRKETSSLSSLDGAFKMENLSVFI